MRPKLRPILLDFSPAFSSEFSPIKRRPSHWDLLFLAVGAVTIGFVAMSYLDCRNQVESAEAKNQSLARKSGVKSVADVSSSSRGRKNSEPTPASDELNVASRAMAQIQTPWNEVLSELEKATDETVALTQMESEAKSRNVRLSGEAKTISDVLAFAERLRKSGRFSEVALVGEESKQAGPVKVVGFTMQAAWSPKP